MAKKYYCNMNIHLQVSTSEPEEFALVLKSVIPEECIEDGLYYRKKSQSLYEFDGIEIPGPNGEYPSGLYDGEEWDDCDEWFFTDYEDFYNQLITSITKVSAGKFTEDNVKLVAKGIGELLDDDHDTVKKFKKSNSRIFVPVDPFDILGGLVPYDAVELRGDFIKFNYWEKTEEPRLKELKDVLVFVEKEKNNRVYEALKKLCKQDSSVYVKVIENLEKKCAPVNMGSMQALEEAVLNGREYVPSSEEWVCAYQPEMER